MEWSDIDGPTSRTIAPTHARTWLRRMRASLRSVFMACSSEEPLYRTSITFPKLPLPSTWGGVDGGLEGVSPGNA